MKFSDKLTLFKFFIALFITAIIVSCNSENHFQTLSFFFDGVPDPNTKTDSTSLTASASDTIKKTTRSNEEAFFVHKPYGEDKCESCHQKGFSNTLIEPVPGLCFTCHADFRNNYKRLHGPVASGYCTNCHNQHMAKYDKLLIRPGQQLCLNCHESKQILQNKMHENIGEKNCTECHNPHGGENKAMLIPGSCNKCHDNFSTKYKFLHGPVASGNCNSCHDSHDSKSNYLLLSQGQQLCYTCHNSETILKIKAHKNIKKNNCTTCHNPHGGDNKFSLINSTNPLKE